MAKRGGQERIAAIEQAIVRRDAFIARVEQAENPMEAARLMAEAIDMQIEANGLEVVGRNGRVFVSIKDVAAGHCLIAARNAFRAKLND